MVPPMAAFGNWHIDLLKTMKVRTAPVKSLGFSTMVPGTTARFCDDPMTGTA